MSGLCGGDPHRHTLLTTKAGTSKREKGVGPLRSAVYLPHYSPWTPPHPTLNWSSPRKGTPASTALGWSDAAADPASWSNTAVDPPISAVPRLAHAVV